MIHTIPPEERNIFRGFALDEKGKREISINGKKQKGNWVVGYMLNKNIIIPIGQFVRASKYNDHYILTSDESFEFYLVVPETVGLYSGRCNAFENDIIKHCFGHEIGIVRYGTYKNPFNDDQYTEHIGFYVDWVVGEEKDDLRKDLGYWLNATVVSGNIFENAIVKAV